MKRNVAQDFPLVEAQECRARQGLPNFLARARKPGSAIKVAYLGGSITAQAGWRPKSLAHFAKTFPGVTLTEINAAIGGTGSDLGVFRLRQDVLDKKPDLLFVEFAVNDGGAPPEQITRCMEGIVRQTWKALPECDICFVYTVTESLVPPLFDGKFPRAASVMERVAEHYGIPSIHLGLEVAELAKAGKLLWKAPLAKEPKPGDPLTFANDGVHPYPETGHELYLQAIARALEPIQAAVQRPERHRLPRPLSPANYERAQLVPLTPARLSPDFIRLDPQTNPQAKSFAGRMGGGLYRTTEAGARIVFSFKGTYAALYDVIGPDCGQVLVTLDDQPARLVPRFDAYCTYHRLATLVIGSDLPDTWHRVTIELHPDPPDKVKILAQRNEKMDNPARFHERALYPGAILVVGELKR